MQIINRLARLYVMKAGHGGYSCIGYDVAERRRVAVLEWIGHKHVPPMRKGSLKHFHAYQDAMMEGLTHSTNTGTRCQAELTPELLPYEGKRVEVTYPDGDRARFIVGKSGGWLPCHIEIARRDSTGGGAAYFPKGARVELV